MRSEDREPSYTLEKLNFDGPLDLLLKLIEKDKIDIYDIPIAEITRQYLEYLDMMQAEDLDVMSDFLVMAATLLDIKARMLLPSEESGEEEEEEDPREELVRRLIQYRRFKYIASELEELEDEASAFLYRDEEDIPKEVSDYVSPVDLDELLCGVDTESLRKLFLEVMRRKEYRRDVRRENFGVIRRERMPIGTRISSLIRYARKNRRFSFRSLLSGEPDREAVVVTFLAMLELMKVGAIRVEQQDTCGDIEVEASEDIDRTSIDLEDIEDD